MKVKKITKANRALLVLLVIAIVGLSVDWALRFVVHTSVSTEFVESKIKADTLIVFMPGVIAPARVSAGSLLDVWLEYGDVLLVDYGDDRFDGHEVVSKTVKAVSVALDAAAYSRMKFIAVSMGGRLASAVKVGLKELETPLTDLVLIDAPMSGHDLVNPLMPFVRIMYTGPIVDTLGLTYFAAGPPSLDNIEPGADQREVMRRVDVARSYKFGFLVDQARYIVELDPLVEDELVGLFETITYIRCTRANTLIESSAISAWALAFPDTVVVELDSTHAGFAEWPKTWNNVFRQTLNPQ